MRAHGRCSRRSRPTHCADMRPCWTIGHPGRSSIGFPAPPATTTAWCERFRTAAPSGAALPMRNGWTGGQYSVFRILLGSYLCEHFLRLLPWGRELFSNQGALPNSSASPLIHLFPNIFGVWDSPAFVLLLLALGAVLGFLLAAGVWDRAAAVVTWGMWTCLLGRDPLIANPSLPYIGWLLLAHAVLLPAPYGI